MIAEIESRIIELLSDIDGVKSVSTAQGNPEEVILETINQRPAIRVVYTGSEYEPPAVINSRLTELTLNFLCIVYATKSQTENAYTIIEGIRDRLQRTNILQYGYMYLKSESLVTIQNGIAVYACEYSIKTSYQ